MATILDGRKVSDSLLEKVKNEVEILKKHGVNPKLVVVVVGNDSASAVYVGKKQEACGKVGILSQKISLPEETSQDELLGIIERLNGDNSVNGVIVQMPLPRHMNPNVVIKAINPYKDVDGFHAYNIGKMFIDKDFEDMSPCTPKGITKILDFYGIDVSGMDCLVIGRSNIVGKPMGVMLLNRNATVTMAHSKTKDLKKYSTQADLVVVAVGKAKFLTADMVKEGVILIDVGMNRGPDGKLCGDSDFEEVSKKASMITPVPGGVGPMTVACLLENTVTAAKKQNSILSH